VSVCKVEVANDYIRWFIQSQILDPSTKNLFVKLRISRINAYSLLKDPLIAFLIIGLVSTLILETFDSLHNIISNFEVPNRSTSWELITTRTKIQIKIVEGLITYIKLIRIISLKFSTAEDSFTT